MPDLAGLGKHFKYLLNKAKYGEAGMLRSTVARGHVGRCSAASSAGWSTAAPARTAGPLSRAMRTTPPPVLEV